MTDAIVLSRTDTDELTYIAKGLVESGYFKDARSAAQGFAKVLAGRELGLGPVESMRSIHIVDGKVELSADLLAQRVRSHGDYDYRIREHTEYECRIEFFGPRIDREPGLESLGESRFTMDDAKRAGLANKNPWKNYPRNMLFARAMSNGVAWFCPDIAGGGRLYVEGEIVGDSDDAPHAESDSPTTIEVEGIVADAETGEILEAELVAGGEPLDGAETDDAGEPSAAQPAPDPRPDVVGTEGSNGRTNTGEKTGDPSGAEAEAGGEALASQGKVEPEPPATASQKRRLGILAGELGWDDERRHTEAGVASFNELTKAQAAKLIGEWGAIVVKSREHDHVWVASAVKKLARCDVEGCPETRAWTEIRGEA